MLGAHTLALVSRKAEEIGLVHILFLHVSLVGPLLLSPYVRWGLPQPVFQLPKVWWVS